MQVEQAYNKVLDRCAARREDMAAVSDKISLGTAVRTLWEDVEEDAVDRQGIGTCVDVASMRLDSAPGI